MAKKKIEVKPWNTGQPKEEGRYLVSYKIKNKNYISLFNYVFDLSKVSDKFGNHPGFYGIQNGVYYEVLTAKEFYKYD